MIIENILGNIVSYQINGRRIEKVTLDREGLSRPHQKLTTESGETFALSLPHGQNLSPGDVLYADETRVIAVELVPEEALVIRPEGHMQWARAAYNIGNMHQTAYIQEDCIVTPYDGILESVMQRLGVPCEKAMCPIDGVRANVSQTQAHHHHHGDGYSHSHVHEGHGHTHMHEHDHAYEGHGHTHVHDHIHADGQTHTHEHTHGHEHDHDHGQMDEHMHEDGGSDA